VYCEIELTVADSPSDGISVDDPFVEVCEVPSLEEECVRERM
jgi:hypothetical protein